MDVFSLLKFWRNAGIGDPITPNDSDITDDESSFFDLVFTNPNDNDDVSGLHFSKSTPHPVFLSNKRKILPLDSSSKSTPKSPFRRVFQNNKPKVKDLKCRIEEVTISSLLNRDNSLRNELNSEKLLEHHDNNDHMTSKRFSKEVFNKYLNLIKPLYKRSNEKVWLMETVSPLTGFVVTPRKEEKPLGKAVFKEVRKRLGKSRSSSSSSAVGKHIPLRRDDSALQHDDGIQSAILHCKKSYNLPSQGCVVLSRSGSAPSYGLRISVDEETRSSV